MECFLKEIVWVDNEEIRIVSSIPPCTGIDKILPSDPDWVKEYKTIKPYINKRDVVFNVRYRDKRYKITILKGYRWDGATIPKGFRWIIGSKGEPSFLNPSMVHDILCENHNLIDNNRELSTIIFRELLIASNISKLKAYTMSIAVDNFQKLFGNW